VEGGVAHGKRAGTSSLLAVTDQVTPEETAVRKDVGGGAAVEQWGRIGTR
jgi:hypothetical protein